MKGRIDLPGYYRACQTIENMVVLPTGGACRRPGLEHIASAYSNDYASRLIGFVKGTDRYVLEFSQSKMRVFKNGAILGAPYELATAWTSAEAQHLVFAPSCKAIFHGDHDIYELVCNSDTSWTLTAFASQYGPFLKANDDQSVTMTPSATSGTGKTLTCSDDFFDDPDHVGALMQLTHDVDEVSLDGQFDNSASPPFTQNETSSAVVVKGRYDVVVKWHGWGKLKFQRSNDDGSTWKTVKTWDKPVGQDDLSIKDAGQEDDDAVQYRFYIDWSSLGDPDSIYDGDLLLWLYFQFNHPYCNYSIKAKNTQQTGICRITGITSAKIATISILNDFGATSSTSEWAEGAWSLYRGYPQCGTIHDERIVAARTDHKPTTVWQGRPFLRREDARLFYGGSTVEDDDAFWRTVDVQGCDTIEWLASLWVMLLGSNGNILKGIGVSDNSPMTPANTNFPPQAGVGSATIQPIIAGGRLIYCGRNRKRIYEMSYSDEAKAFNPEELTKFADHIAGSGIAGWCFQQQPYPIIWAWTDDGEIVGITRNKEENLLAPHRHNTEGTVESMCVIPSDTDDEVWVSMARTVGGSTVRSIERMKPFDWETSQRDCFFVDAGTTWDGGAAVTVTGISVNATTHKVTVTASGHGFSDGYKVRFADVAGMTDLNGKVYTVSDAAATTFILKTRDGSAYIDGSGFETYISGGEVERVINSVSSLSHLAGEAVAVLLDGQPASGSVSSTGVYTIGNGTKDGHFANTIHVGRPFTHKLMPMRPEIATRNGSIQSLKKKITYVGARLYKSAGGQYGTSVNDLQDIVYADRGDDANADVAIVSEDRFVDGPGGWEEGGDIYFEGSDPLPFTLTSILYGMEA